jgi:NAD(P)-dependent dehydrogenase (short-subunit alcohol dehydrogenase family)
MATGNGRVAVVTGASSGIGKETARALAAAGWHVIATGRDPARSAAAAEDIRAASVGGRVDMLVADLSLLAEAARLARDIAAITPRVDVLINNAGGMANGLVMTAEGYEANFAGNHLGPFLLTNRLMPLLRAAAATAPLGSVRIINTASDASEMIPTLNLDDMQNLGNYSNGLAYCSGKLANVLFARALAGRLAGDGIVAHAMHPGAVDSRFFDDIDAEARARVRDLPKVSVAEGADTLIWLATSEEPGRSSGLYWHKRALRAPNPVVEDSAFVARFWDESERLVARAGVQVAIHGDAHA